MIAGLVLHLHQSEQLVADTLCSIEQNPRVTAGERTGWRLPVVIDADHTRHSHELTDNLRELKGVIHIDVAYVDYEFDDPDKLSNEKQCSEKQESGR